MLPGWDRQVLPHPHQADCRAAPPVAAQTPSTMPGPGHCPGCMTLVSTGSGDSGAPRRVRLPSRSRMTTLLASIAEQPATSVATTDPGRPFTGGERELPESTPEMQRDQLVAAIEGLTDAQSRLKLVTSLTTPLSLVKHCAAAERIWFQRTLGGMREEDCDGHAVGGDSSFHVPENQTLATDNRQIPCSMPKIAGNRRAHGLDDTSEHRLGGTVNLRFIYLGMPAPPTRPDRTCRADCHRSSLPATAVADDPVPSKRSFAESWSSGPDDRDHCFRL